LLVEKGVDICAQKDKAFRKACSCGQTEIVKFLLDNGANVHANDEESLHWACLYGYEETVDILLQNGAVVQEKNIANIFEYTYYPLLVKLLSHYKGDLQPIYEKFSNRIETVKVFLEFFSKNKSLL
jgi:ankyrin repeat protein